MSEEEKKVVDRDIAINTDEIGGVLSERKQYRRMCKVYKTIF